MRIEEKLECECGHRTWINAEVTMEDDCLVAIVVDDQGNPIPGNAVQCEECGKYLEVCADISLGATTMNDPEDIDKVIYELWFAELAKWYNVDDMDTMTVYSIANEEVNYCTDLDLAERGITKDMVEYAKRMAEKYEL